MSHPSPLPGVEVVRRSVLKLPVAVAGTLFLRSLARASASAGTADSFDEFGRRWSERADALAEASAAGAEEAYLFELCRDLTGVPVADLPRLKKTAHESPTLRSGPAWGSERVFLVELQLQPGAVLPAHNHVGMNFVTLGLEGECEYHHFEPVGDLPPVDPSEPATFPVQATRSGVLRPGRLTSLSRRRDNIHWFRAGEQGATLLDFGTKLPAGQQGYAEAFFLDFDETPIDPGRRLFEARWIENPYR